jgi:hypothetical protein
MVLTIRACDTRSMEGRKPWMRMRARPRLGQVSPPIHLEHVCYIWNMFVLSTWMRSLFSPSHARTSRYTRHAFPQEFVCLSLQVKDMHLSASFHERVKSLGRHSACQTHEICSFQPEDLLNIPLDWIVGSSDSEQSKPQHSHCSGSFQNDASSSWDICAANARQDAEEDARHVRVPHVGFKQDVIIANYSSDNNTEDMPLAETPAAFKTALEEYREPDFDVCAAAM